MSPGAATVTNDDLPLTACFSVHAHAEPGVMPRVLELFAKRGLGRDAMDYIAACLRQITFVEVVLTSQKT